MEQLCCRIFVTLTLQNNASFFPKWLNQFTLLLPEYESSFCSISFPKCCILGHFNIKQLSVFVLLSHHVFNLHFPDYFYVLYVHAFMSDLYVL